MIREDCKKLIRCYRNPDIKVLFSFAERRNQQNPYMNLDFRSITIDK